MLIAILSISGFLVIFGGQVVYSWIRLGKREAIKPFLVIFPFLRKRFSASASQEHTRQYLADFTYFTKLSPEQQEKFLGRINEFIATKEFRSRSLFVTDEMKVKIAACAIQLLFGLEEFYLPFFDSILVYDGLIVNRLGKYEHLVTNNGSIAISWTAFERGYKDATDCHNAGLCAFADAMQLGVDMFPGDDPMLSEKFEEWQKNSSNAISRLKGPVISPLSKAAASGRRVFFSSCIEYFFEAPMQLKSLHPDLYEYIAKVLKQDPLSPSRVFEGGQSNGVEARWRKQRKMAYFHVFAITISIVAGIPSLFYFLSCTAIATWMGLSFPILLFAAWLLSKMINEDSTKLLTRLSIVAMLGYSIIITSTLFAVNFVGAHGNTYVEKYRVVNYESTRRVSRGRYGSTYVSYVVVYTLEDDAYGGSYFLRRYEGRAPSPDAPYMQFIFKSGLLGMKVLQGTQWLNDQDQVFDTEMLSFN